MFNTLYKTRNIVLLLSTNQKTLYQPKTNHKYIYPSKWYVFGTLVLSQKHMKCESRHVYNETDYKLWLDHWEMQEKFSILKMC